MGFIAGRYSVTLAGSTVGQLGRDGLLLEHSVFKQLIVGDNFAQAPQDGIFQGQEMFAQYVLLEYDATSARAAFWPYGSSYLNQSVAIGTLDSSNGGQLIATAISGTPASAAPASLTLPTVILSAGAATVLNFSSNHRIIPVRQRVYHNTSGVFGTLT